jgi:hydrocephalus-inducing protein
VEGSGLASGPLRNPPFSLEPMSGFVDAGQTTTFQINFRPEDVDEYSGIFRCEIDCLEKDVPPPEINVYGRSRRPVCHFNVKTSDYISAGRRHPNYTDPLPPDVKVIEMFSHQIGELSTTKFEIINTTERPYEIVWERCGSNDDAAITCDNQRTLISSGRRHSASFSFLPMSVKTLESLWHFTIPEYEIHVYILIVGRIMPT